MSMEVSEQDERTGVAKNLTRHNQLSFLVTVWQVLKTFPWPVLFPNQAFMYGETNYSFLVYMSWSKGDNPSILQWESSSTPKILLPLLSWDSSQQHSGNSTTRQYENTESLYQKGNWYEKWTGKLTKEVSFEYKQKYAKRYSSLTSFTTYSRKKSIWLPALN